MNREIHGLRRRDAACVAAAALVACIALPARAEDPPAPVSESSESATDLKVPAPPATTPPAPVAAPASPRKPRLPLAIEARWSEADIDAVRLAPPFQVSSRGERVRIAVETTLHDEAAYSRRMGVVGGIDTNLFPELAEDTWITDQRSDAAESVITSAIETACDVAFFDGKRRSQGIVLRPTVAVRDHGVRIDASPGWSYRVTAARSGFRIELPFIPTSSVRLHAYHDLKGTDRGAQRIGFGLNIDPFDQAVRAGISFQF
jgi:hypothetical protein